MLMSRFLTPKLTIKGTPRTAYGFPHQKFFEIIENGHWNDEMTRIQVSKKKSDFYSFCE